MGHRIVVILNDYETVRGNVKIIFLLWGIFNNVFSRENGVQFC